MRALRATVVLRFVSLLTLSACGATSAGPSEHAAADAGPLPSVTSDSGQLTFDVRAMPDQPPTRGVSTVLLDVSDATSGEPVDGLELTVVPWMPAMGHGTSVKPTVEAKGGGQYVVSRVNMYMGGKWDVRITIAGTVSDRATLHFSIR